jgi:hypothetical protein
MSTELATRQMDALAFEPQSLSEAMSYANMLSKSGLMAKHLVGKPADIMLIMAKGRELGLSTMVAISGINVIQGKVELSPQTMVAVVQKRPDVCKYFTLIESTDTIATFETWRVGAPEPVRMSFTADDAKKMQLWGKDNYNKQPATMLRWRCISAICRLVYPDILAGGPYATGEISGEPMEEPRDVTPVSSPAVAVAPAIVPTPPEMVAATGGEFQRPEFDDESEEQKQHLLEAEYRLATWPSGSSKGQFLEASSLDELKAKREYLAGRVPTPGNVKMLGAIDFWIAEKSK